MRELKLLCTLLLIVSTGCTVGPNYSAPQSPVPEQWLAPTSAPATNQSVPFVQAQSLTRWWEVFDDPEMHSLIARGLKSNLTLRDARARIREARARRTIAGADQLPTLDSSGGYQRITASDRSSDLFRAGLDAAWELDVFGGIRRSVEASDASLQISVEQYRDTMVSLVAEIALDYIDLRGFQREIAIAKRNLALQQHTLDLTKQRFPAFVGRLDLVQAQASVATTSAQIPSLEEASRRTMYSLAVLLGAQPAALVDELSVVGPIPRPPLAVPVGLPSELLLRRPDVRQAQANVHLTTAQIGVATADIFPRFTLTGSLGSSSDQLHSLLNWNNVSTSIGPGVSWPIFQGGRIRANIQAQNALQEQALAAYENTVLTALSDVESSLISYEKEQQRLESLNDAVNANRQAVDIATSFYAQGQTDFLNVLTTQQSLLQTEDAQAQSERTIATNLVALYKALGGGWEDPAPATTRPTDKSLPLTRANPLDADLK